MIEQVQLPQSRAGDSYLRASACAAVLNRLLCQRQLQRVRKGILVNATPENKRRANKWLDDLTTSGTSNPIPGLEVAFRAHPDLMYILTDGDFPNNNEVLTTVAKANASKKTRINSVAFVSKADDETSESFKKFLVALAEGNGGKFKRVSLDQLDQ